MEVSIIVANYNGSAFLQHLLETLSAQTLDDFEVIFVDNKSTDGSLHKLEEFLAEENGQKLHVKLIRLHKNLGYCRSNNIGARRAKGRYLVFLNNDTFVSPTWLAELTDVMNKTKKVGACQSRLFQPQTGEVQTDGWYLDKYGFSQQLIINSKNRGTSTKPFFLSGASLMVRKADFDQISGFDDELLNGDYDLCWRLRLLGYNMVVSLDSHCFHYGSVTLNKLYSLIDRVYHHTRESIRVLFKNYTIMNVFGRIPLTIILMMIVPVLLAVLKSPRYPFSPIYYKSILKGVLWNLCHFKESMVLRSKTQEYRKVSDRSIEQAMCQFSVVLSRRLGTYM